LGGFVLRAVLNHLLRAGTSRAPWIDVKAGFF